MDSLAKQMKNKYVNINTGSPILKSIDPNINNENSFQNSSLNCTPVSEIMDSLNLCGEIYGTGTRSILLLDDQERIRVSSQEAFQKLLKIKAGKKVKVISVFGNTGEGKSYTMNEVFFDGEEVFRTSSSQTSCTLGVWAAYNPKLNVICLDTEGMLGISKKEHQRTRLLLKVLAVSDVIVFRTRAERLQRDMYTFLGGASKAYKAHFSFVLRKVLCGTEGDKLDSSLGFGPGVVIFHETRHTDSLNDSTNVAQSPEDILQTTFADLGLSYDSFSFIKYVGVRTKTETSFKELKSVLLAKLESTEVRSFRDPKYIYLTLKSLNDKFQNEISDSSPQLYLPAFFTCQEKCQSCKNSCTLSMGHKEEGEPHFSTKDCKFQHQYQNCIQLCKVCYKNGSKTVVKPSYLTTNDASWSGYFNYVWAGYVIECPNCGEIYRSRQHWYGNKNPEDCAIRTEVVHIWPGERSFMGSQHAAQKVVDGVAMVADMIATVGEQPKKVLTDLAADLTQPQYWTPNKDIKECFKCNTPFSTTVGIHHCRACGKGFCEACSSKRQTVPSKGWLNEVRVCNDCYREEPPSLTHAIEGTDNRVRQIGEMVVNTLSTVKSVLDKPRNAIKNMAQPAYWTPNELCVNCAVCRSSFGPALLVHHCRECGKGVCDDCSTARKPVPLMGWDSPVRVCDQCR